MFTFTSNKVSKRTSHLSSLDFWASELWSKSGREEGRKRAIFFSSPNSEISKMLTLSTAPFRLIINVHFFSENKMDIFRSFLTLFSFKIPKTKSNYNQLYHLGHSLPPPCRTLRGSITLRELPVFC